jgi:AcrR family transcriptional regulator
LLRERGVEVAARARGAQASAGGTSRRDLAVARVLDPARARAETRVQRFLDAALELMNNTATKDFTVQEVVEKSGQSLRSFYQYFDGKYELLLALFEEAVRTTAAHLEEFVADENDPLERLHLFSVEYYRLCRPGAARVATKHTTTRATAEFAQQLLTEHPREAAHAFQPLVTLLERLLDEGATAGALRGELNHRRIAGLMLQAIMFNAFAITISGSSSKADVTAAAEELWDLLLHGIQAAQPSRK